MGFFITFTQNISHYMKSKLLVAFFLLSVSFMFSQEVTEQEDKSLNEQFDKIYRTSTTYQTYKVISKDKYQNLKKNVLDSIKKANKEITEKERQLKVEKNNVDKLNVELQQTKTDLDKALQKENSISFLGIQLSKTAYNVILWSIIILVTVALAVFIFKFLRSNVLTQKAQENLEDVEHEFEVHRKKSLEREQKLRRQLQDEINKQRNS